MFTVEDVNSVLLNDKVNDFHSIDTSLRAGLDYVLLDFVKVRKSVSGFSFDVDNSLWTGGFYLTTTGGEYISLTSSDYSYSDGVLSVATSESDVVLVLYCSSFFSVFSLQYLDCRLDSLFSVVNEISVTTDDFTSLNGTAITDSDISVSDSVVTCRSNVFYKGIVELDDVAMITVDTDSLIAGSPSQTITLTASEDIAGVTVEYGNISEYVPFDEGMGSFNADLSEHLTTDDFVFKAVFNGIVFDLNVPVAIITVNSRSSLGSALSSKIKIISFAGDWLNSMGAVFEVDYDVTLLCNHHGINGLFRIHDGVNFVLDDYYHTGDGFPIEFDVGENVNLTLKNCTLLNGLGRDYCVIFANEDIENTNSQIIIDNCRFYNCDAPVIIFDGELIVRDSVFEYPNITSRTTVFEPSFVHMSGGSLTVHNTQFKTMNPNGTAKELSGYNLASLLLSEDTVFNGVTATELSKGNPSLNQAGITSTMNVNYQNGDETVHLTDGFYVAVEDKKIKNIKED